MGHTVAPPVGPAPIEQFLYDGQHLVARYENSNLVNRYLHGPAVDMILADEQIDTGTSTSNTLLPLTDHQGTVRDLTDRDDTTGVTAIANHLVYDSFGKLVSETHSAVDHIFGYTGHGQHCGE